MLSRISYFICLLIISYGCLCFYPKWNEDEGEVPIGWDVSGYYWYLPSVFIYKDLKYQSFADSVISKYKPTPIIQQFTRLEDSSCVMTYSSGMAFMYLPLFAAAHITAPMLGYPADGFSPPYQFALQVGSLLIGLFGLWYFRRFLLYYFEDKVVAILLLLLAIGTNYLNYTAIDGPMTHNWLFVIYVLLLLNTRNFYLSPSYKYALRIGILCGLAILIRPSEIVAVCIPLLWGLNGIALTDIKQHLHFIKQHFIKLLVAVIAVISIGSVQLFYWKYSSGHWLFYSYTAPRQSFTWLPPHIDDYLFSYRSGWLIYTPLMMLALLGFLPFLRKGQNLVAVSVFMFCTLYIVSAWDTWWYGGLGGRAMIQSYPILFIPFGYLVTEMFNRKLLMILLIPIMLAFSYVSIWVTIQTHKGTGLLDVESMSKAYYWHVVGRWHINDKEEAEKLKDTEHIFTGTLKDKKLEYSSNYENDTTILEMPLPAIEGSKSAYVNENVEFSKILRFPLQTNKKWLRVQAIAKCTIKEWTVWKMPQFSIRLFNSKGGIIETSMIRLHRHLTNNAQKLIHFDIHIPDGISQAEVYLWNPGSDKLLMIDDLQIWSFDE
ncbi:MAG TPA: hypothetical protein VK167_01035 [Flavipsychrobacter sp.]|nr:hypothetical protein [Flavipsychrobacter sp.]